MKKFLKYALVLSIFSSMSLFVACSDDEDDETKPTTSNNNSSNNSNSTCSTAQFCMNYGGTEYFGAATYSEINANRHRIKWDNGSSTNLVQMEIDIMGDAVGAYPIDGSYSAGTAAMEFFDGTASSANADTLHITEFDLNGSGISGYFTTVMSDSTIVNSGNIRNVK